MNESVILLVYVYESDLRLGTRALRVETDEAQYAS